jgi:hypothetical protein
VRKARAAALIAIVAAFAAAPLGAQRVRGTLTDSSTKEPIGGAVVTVFDSAGKYLARSIADGDGKFAVMRVVGSRKMRVIRIGYTPRDIPIVDADSIYNVRMQPVASRLATMSSTGKRICPGENASADALELWEQARAGLLASVVAREAFPPRVRIRTSRKTLEPIRRQILQDSVDLKDLVVERSFVAARPAWAFAENGYIRESAGGERDYYAPDEAVMLDATFAATHCLHVIQGNGPRFGETGIAFEPIIDAARDTLVDVTGVLWLQRDSLRLKSLEFQYTNLEPAAKGSGGEIWFAIMPSGAAMVERWAIKTPVLAFDEEANPTGVRRAVPPRVRRTNTRTIGYRETSGQIISATWPDGREWHGDSPRVTGIVSNLQGEPVPGAVVWLRDGRDTASTNADGIFHLPYQPPGIYTVLASDSVLAGEGISRTVAVRVQLFSAGDHALSLRLHPRSEVFPLLCPANSYKEGTGVLLAKLLMSDGTPAANARIEVEATQLIVVGDTIARPSIRKGEAGEDGRFVICGIDKSRRLIVRAFKGREAAGVALDNWLDDVAPVTINLKSMPAPAAPPRL